MQTTRESTSLLDVAVGPAQTGEHSEDVAPPALPVPPEPARRAAPPDRPRSGLVAKIAFALGVVVLLIAALWTPIAVPALVKFPTSTNAHLAYSGTFVTYVNPKTGATLASPAVSPLTISRHIQALPAESTSSVVLVRETLAVRAGTSSSNEVNVYALDRRTMKAVADPRAYTFKPGNVPGRGSSYYVTLPMGLSSTTSPLSIWKPESATEYLVSPIPGGTASNPSTLDGQSVVWFAGTLKMTPAPAYERASLAARGLPMSLTPAAVQARLAAAGVSVSRLSTALLPVLTKAEVGTLLAVLSKPVALQYFIFGSGQLAAEPRTGTIVKLQGIVDGVAAKSDPAPMQTVVAILNRHLNVPGVRQAVAAIGRLEAAPPQPIYELRYTETPAAVASSVTLARNQIGQINLATRDLPIGLGILGLLLLSPAVVGIVRRRRRTAGSPGSGRSVHDSFPEPKAA